MGFTSYSRRAQGRRSSRQEIDELDISTNIVIPPFPGRETMTTTLREGGKAREPLSGSDSAFQHGATEMELGRTTINSGDAETPFAYGRGGVVGWAQPGGYGEEGEEGCCSVFSQSSFGNTLACPPEPPVVLLQRQVGPAGLRSVHACERCEHTTRGRQGKKRGRVTSPQVGSCRCWRGRRGPPDTPAQPKDTLAPFVVLDRVSRMMANPQAKETISSAWRCTTPPDVPTSNSTHLRSERERERADTGTAPDRSH